MSARRKTALRVLHLWTVGVVLFVIAAPGLTREDGRRLDQLKVAYVYNFTRFVEWPTSTEGAPFVIGVIGDAAMAEHLRVLDDRQVGGQPISVVSYSHVADVARPQILFVGREAEAELAEIIRATHGQPTLLVGDTDGYATRGVAIEFVVKTDVFREKQRLRFRIAPAALRDRGLVVAAQLLDVAEIVP
jgi:hypothetical protein